MSQLISLEAGLFSLGIIAFAWAADNRFTQTVADTAPGLLAAAGLLATVIGVALGGFDAGDGLLELRPDVGVALLASAVGLASALSIKVRYAVAGIPRLLPSTRGPAIAICWACWSGSSRCRSARAAVEEAAGVVEDRADISSARAVLVTCNNGFGTTLFPPLRSGGS